MENPLQHSLDSLEGDVENAGVLSVIPATPEMSDALTLEEGEGELTDIDLGNTSVVQKKTILQKLNENASVLKAVHLGVGFCLLFLGFDACQDLVTTFHEKDGSAGLAILYVVYGISSFFAPVVVSKIGTRLSLLFASLCYVTFIVCVEPYLDFIFFPISVVEGVAAAVLWTAQPVYLSKCAPDATVLGKFSGIFYSIFQSALILGNLLSGALLSSAIREESLLYILAGISFCGSITIGLLRNPKPSAKVKELSLMQSIELDSSDFAHKTHASPPTSPVMETKKKESTPEKSPFLLVVRTLKLCVTTKMLWLHPLFIHQGLSNAIFMGAFPLQMRADRIGFVIAVLGISNVAGSVIWGKIYDWKGWKVLTVGAIILGPLAYFASTLNSIGLWPLFLAAIGFGFLDSCQNTLVFGIISSVYPEEQEQICAFAVSKFSNACASGVSFFLISYLRYATLAAIATGNIIIVCGCICGLYLWNSFVLPSFLQKHKHEQFHDEI
eukprot:Phypoly_transcript_03221.p1 GENE.Phypoly_transcript_03221~~Phypoly_transcript_03221.p1  ORF type:complete len:498 (+),score=46.05 Phypoly_transcript_03221:115-1608(+)